ncbi:unnamed protein product [Moneuplotes crassus]|uniref:14-3-3 domain-containing protein n=1 Tax=Euplotes crassus TaxID=5936 RepID=A0AAD2D2Z0_EUPCR|nr:unnamed protein product [Moneuplotes crassus]
MAEIFMARVADQAERYEDMVEFLKEVIDTKSEDLSIEERNLLSVGFKNFISSSRSAYRVIGTIETNSKYKDYTEDCKAYKNKIREELEQKCMKVIEIVKTKSLPKATEKESITFYHKMIGDYYRYIAENYGPDKDPPNLDSIGVMGKVSEYYEQEKDSENPVLFESSKGALEHYEKATKAAADLKPYNSTKLGLALNCSVFYYEIKSDIPKACKIAEAALEDAKKSIDNMDNEDARDSLSIVELLKENLSLWQEENVDN